MPKRTVVLAVRGTRYHQGQAAQARGLLEPGAAVRLRHEPNNPHDTNAVEILLQSTGHRLGHVSRKLAPRYVALLKAGAVGSARVASVEGQGSDLRIKVQLVLILDGHDFAGRKLEASEVLLNAASLPASPGIYEILREPDGPVYVGSTRSIRARIKKHFADLNRGRHHNAPLQEDYRRHGVRAFAVRSAARFGDRAELEAAERQLIEQHLVEGSELYNLTFDGKGRPQGDRSQADEPQTVSERYDHGDDGTALQPAVVMTAAPDRVPPKAHEPTTAESSSTWWIWALIAGFLILASNG